MRTTFALLLLGFTIPLAFADQGSITNSGSSANPAGTLTISSNTLSYVSADGSTIISATFTTSSSNESCQGGGKGGHITCYTTFTGTFSGTLSVHNVLQAINGNTYQSGKVGGTQGGTTVYNSAYTPFYFSDSEQIHRSDDIYGTNMISCCAQGFYGAYGLALDSRGRIYVADTYNARVVRIDDMNGTNWTSFGAYGSDVGQFNDPQGIAVDSLGRIYVMDTNNSRLVRMDDMNGTNWTVFNAVGTGPGQLSTFINVAVDSSNRIYVADSGNLQIVRMDDMTGANWTVLNQSQPVNGYSYKFVSPMAVAIDPNGKIYVADNEGAPSVVRVDDMTGANWTTIAVSPVGSGGLNSIASDSSGLVFTGGGGVRLVDNMAGFVASTNGICPIGCYYVFGVTPVPITNPRPSAISFTPNALTFSQNLGTTSAPQTITIRNFGGTQINNLSVSITGGFAGTNDCPSVLLPGSTCAVSITFTPAAWGTITGSVNVTDDSYNAGSSQSLVLTGTGTIPVAKVTPTSLSFSSQVLGTISSAKTITLQNVGTSAMNVASVNVSGPFSQTNNCPASLAASASCTISVTFSPVSVGAAVGAVTITDDAGVQAVALTGTGSSPVQFSPVSLSFGSLAVGSTSSPSTVTVTNRLGTALTVSSVTASAGFAVSSNTCVPSIPGGGSCSISVTFTPTAAGSVTGSLTFSDSALNSPQTVGLSGTGTAAITLSTNSLSFSSTVVGATSAAKTVTLTNQQTIALNFSSITASGPFAIASNTCASPLAGGASCTVGVTFTPVAIGSATGTLTFTDDGGTQSVTLSGTGGAAVTFNPASLSFGTVRVNTTSLAKVVVLTNHLSAALNIAGITASSGFVVSNTTCGASVAAGGSCIVSVKFAPTVSGAITGTLTVTDSAAGSLQTVSLSGTGL